MPEVLYPSGAAMTELKVARTSPVPWSINTMLQIAQLMGILVGVVYVAFLVGQRDAVLTAIVEGQRTTTAALAIQSASIAQVREDVAAIKGRLDR